jgi:hypothetical protein
VHHLPVAHEQREQQPERGRKAVFKVPAIALLAVAFLAFCMTPVALGEVNGLEWLYILPLALLVYVLRMRTVADAGGLTVRTVFGHRKLPWSALKGLSVAGRRRSKVRAVLKDDTMVTLPTVRPRHLPVLSLVSGGLVPDPSGLLDDQDQQPDP